MHGAERRMSWAPPLYNPIRLSLRHRPPSATQAADAISIYMHMYMCGWSDAHGQ